MVFTASGPSFDWKWFFCFFIFSKTSKNTSSLLDLRITELVQMKFESGGSMKGLSSNDDVMNYKELSAYLKLSENTLRIKVMKGTIPSFKIDGAVRFSKKKIDEWLEGLHRDTKKKTLKNKNDLFTTDNGEEAK